MAAYIQCIEISDVSDEISGYFLRPSFSYLQDGCDRILCRSIFLIIHGVTMDVYLQKSF